MTKSDPKAASDGPQENAGKSAGTDRDTMMAVLSYVPIVCLLPLLQDDPKSELRRHARQGLVLMLFELIILVLLIPGVSAFLLWLGFALCMLFAAFGAWNAWQGKFWRIPIISDLAERSGAGGDSS
jgi:uncharacterized membrane protein